MTNIVRNSLIGQPNVELDALEVRQIIDANHGSEFDFTPQSKEAGFFYISESRQVLVVKYEDMANGVPLSSEPQTYLLNDTEDYEFGLTPEEIFGSGKFLLTTKGSAVAEVVSAIRNYYQVVVVEGKSIEAIDGGSSSLSGLLKPLFQNLVQQHL
jgi:hypothetical protein